MAGRQPRTPTLWRRAAPRNRFRATNLPSLAFNGGACVGGTNGFSNRNEEGHEVKD